MVRYAFLYLVYFFVPGLLIARFAGLRSLAWRLCLPFSFAFLAVNIFAAKLLGISASVFVLAVNIQVLGLVYIYYLVNRDFFPIFASGATGAARIIAGLAQQHRQALLVAMSVFLPVSVYLIWAGPYTEVPSDFWQHIGKTQSEYLSLVNDGKLLGFETWWDFGGKGAGYWYAIHAFLCFSAGITVDQSYGAQSFLNSILFLVAVFLFTVRITTGSGLSRLGRYVAAALAVVFFLAHFGTNVFSFVRYYAFGPVIFNYVFYLIFIVTVLDILGGAKHSKTGSILVLILLLVLMTINHVQETMFSVIMAYALLFFVWLKRSVFGHATLEGFTGEYSPLTIRQLDWAFYSITAIGVIAVLIVHFSLERHDPYAFNRLINLNEILPFVQHMYVLDPNKQLYQTFTPWGYFVGLMFVLFWNKLKNNPVLVCGMLSPFYTVLNPVFTDLFLRISWPELLWRLLYLAPLPIVGGIVFFHCSAWLWGRERPIKAAYGLAVCALLIGLLFPLRTTFIDSPYSRFYTLKKVSPEDDHRRWKDLYSYLDSLENQRKILTDPVTGYTVRALTKHKYFGAKFSRVWWGGYKEFTFDEYALDKFRRYDGWLFVINQRDGGYSETGNISRHWNGIQREVHRYYNDELLAFIEQHQEIFVSQWRSDEIDVYEVRFDGAENGTS